MENLRTLIGKYFDYTFDFEFIDIIEDLVNRTVNNYEEDEADLSDAVMQAIDDGLIYTEDRRTVVRYYTDPEDKVSFDDIVEMLYSDVYAIADMVI